MIELCSEIFMASHSVFILVSAEGPEFFFALRAKTVQFLFALHVGHCAVIFVTGVWAERA